MSRLANQMNAGYVPTPPDVVRRIAQHLGQPHRPFRILGNHYPRKEEHNDTIRYGQRITG